MGGARLPKNLIPQKGGLPARYFFKPKAVDGQGAWILWVLPVRFRWPLSPSLPPSFSLLPFLSPSLLPSPFIPPVSLCLPLPI